MLPKHYSKKYRQSK